MKKLIYFLLFAGSITAKAQNPSYSWAHGWGSINTDRSTYVTTDVNGNAYCTGVFTDTVDFDPDTSAFVVSSMGLNDIFLSKFDPNGSLIWSKTFGGIGNETVNAMTIDGSGNILLTGQFYNTVDFDPGVDTFDLTSNGNGDMFTVKLDESGNFIWAISIGGTSPFDTGRSITTDSDNNVYITGNFASSMDADPGAGTYNLSFTNGTLYLLKLDSNSNFLFAKNFGGLVGPGMNNLIINCIDLDAASNIYIAGSFMSVPGIDFDPGPGTHSEATLSETNFDMYLLKLDTGGNFMWVKVIGDTNRDAINSAYIQGSNIYLTGYFELSPDFDPGLGTHNLTSAGDYDIFICALDTSGTFVWAEGMGGISADVGNSIIANSLGDIFVTGTFYFTVDFDSGPGVFNLTSFGAADTYIIKTSSSGSFIWATNYGGSGNENSFSMAVTPDGSIYTAGSFYGVANFDPGNTDYTLIDNSYGDAYLHKMEILQTTGFDDELNQDELIHVYPNPFKDVLQIVSETELNNIQVYNELGTIISSYNTDESSILINLGNLNSGIYFLRVNSTTYRIIKSD